MQGQALPGFRDFYPEQLALRNHIFATWRSVARRYGFEEYDGPPLEPLELYTGKSGEEIVQQLYAFEDKAGRKVALRPEMTPTLARMVGARAQSLKKPIRWFSIPQLFRYERQQRGRLREHFQLNMDIIGEGGPAADAEVMAAALDIVRALGPAPPTCGCGSPTAASSWPSSSASTESARRRFPESWPRSTSSSATPPGRKHNCRARWE